MLVEVRFGMREIEDCYISELDQSHQSTRRCRYAVSFLLDVFHQTCGLHRYDLQQGDHCTLYCRKG